MDKSTQDAMFSSKSAEWATPQHFFDKLEEFFGTFTLDPCSNASNYKVKNHFTEKDDGLAQDWGGHNVFMNPPYGRTIKHWVEKAYNESRKENTTVVALLPARTDTKYWHEFVMKAEALYFVKGRLKFGNGDGSAPFPSVVALFKRVDGPAAMPRLGVLLAKEKRK
jgi:site-specific DNA-methyltransferase (adenine-specific)